MSSADRRPRDAGGRSRWSLAARLTALCAGAIVATALAASAFLNLGLEAAAARQDDAFLLGKAGALADLLRAEPRDPAAIEREVAEDANGPRRAYARVVDPDGGRVLFEAPGMAGELGPADFPAEGETRAAETRGRSGAVYRVIATRVQGAGEQPLAVQVALDLAPVREMLAEYRRRVAVVLLAALLVAVPGGYQLARAGLRPLRRINEATRAVEPGTLGGRVPTDGLPREVRDLADEVNLMLDRLEAAFVRLRGFSDDIAHELRTPVQSILGSAEVALERARTAQEYREALTSILEDADRMSRTVQGLLFLARAEDPTAVIRREVLDLSREIEVIRDFYEAAAAEAGIGLTAAATPDCPPLAADRTLIQRAVGNLVANAIAHTPPGGTVMLVAARDGASGVRIEVADTGRGIAPEHLPKLFDRFYRADPARDASAGHLGLGLAIVKGIAVLHRGDVTIESEPGRGTRVCLLLPPADATGHVPSAAT